MRTHKLKLHAGTKQDRTFEVASEKTFLLWQSFSHTHWNATELLLNVHHFSRFCIVLQKPVGVSFNFDKYSNLCIISTLQFWMIENFPCTLSFPSSKKVLLVINKNIAFRFPNAIKIKTTLGYKLKIYYFIEVRTKTNAWLQLSNKSFCLFPAKFLQLTKCMVKVPITRLESLVIL